MNPCLSYILPSVVCTYCLQARDLDLTRDKALTDRSWQCGVCGHGYNTDLVESALVDIGQFTILI